ncbi:hypothetical protein SEMRO_1302_G260880.1 [Seminavis robusta]|uniref:Uncharacterized protein n=1 Tax=Seminavis robusta TaxID=568900 RepID=A0A9N8HRR5_9STRA|nr:hypothetical protein SEMRO_1302_G260880.1 [Seminavis robusta]|eukprot:Sro1302_g260880.1 n/a (176) ;mRNA; r:8571-9098
MESTEEEYDDTGEQIVAESTLALFQQLLVRLKSRRWFVVPTSNDLALANNSITTVLSLDFLTIYHMLLATAIVVEKSDADGTVQTEVCNEESITALNQRFKRPKLQFRTMEMSLLGSTEPRRLLFVIRNKPRATEMHPSINFPGSKVHDGGGNRIRRPVHTRSPIHYITKGAATS